MKHPALGINISCLMIPNSDVIHVSDCLGMMHFDGGFDGGFENEDNFKKLRFTEHFFEGKPYTVLLEYYKVFDFLVSEKYVELTENHLKKCICSKNVLELSNFHPLKEACQNFVNNLETIWKSSLELKSKNAVKVTEKVIEPRFQEFVNNDLSFLQCPDCIRIFALPVLERRVIGLNSRTNYTSINCPYYDCEEGRELKWLRVERRRHANTQHIRQKRIDFEDDLSAPGMNGVEFAEAVTDEESEYDSSD